MNKRIFVVLTVCLLVLTGCGKQYTKESFGQEMEAAITEAIQTQGSSYQNRSKSYYSYYLSPGLGHRSATKAADILVCDHNEVLMSIVASSVISSKYYASDADYLNNFIDKNAYYSDSFPGVDINGNNTRFLVTTYKVDNEYYLMVRTQYFYYLTKARLDQMPQIVRDIISVARTTTINQDAIVMAYSSKEVIDYENRQVYSVFTQTAPENGTLAEMLVDYFDQYDETGENPEIDFYKDIKEGYDEY